ncbi:RT0821/Lpp0805 family surface protein [Pararhizobium gei]|uniref:RT0821/Lpp0805 family surface protein n=1 Tax=Pararhizobium gei TaxID=1395951 RepID=UPI0023D9E3F5|nr:RT0821/Lpp0805 family surface protein [Rhizobium gei]
MQDIAKWFEETKALSRAGRVATLFVLTASLSGCLGSGLDFAQPDTVDKSIATGAIPSVNPAEENPDAVTVRNAVSSADIAETSGNPIPWANSQSGSAGVISAISEEQVNGRTCRRFTTTRHSYQGIAKFDGKACLLSGGQWTMTSFAPRS